ncbi:hypothetical protein RND71_023885 [Anisodus tanguticus]|uniref:Retrovirus-related Pol polyprotein from transposon TNT 1-94-like beta-barrel domain-containing protein n=1 Tax=Anisodus tanguticus TaxID=243964 RepID=A0AAE1RV84_9SOLA|nr:hypothetical protein RND71_023885 [Anisodus tanguticus]
MDTGATSHLTRTACNIPKLFHLKYPQYIIVGNGYRIPIQGYGTTYTQPPHPPFSLNNILYAPNIIKNLKSVRKFTHNNSVSVDFDPFGFNVKDLRTGTPLMRCNSTEDIYLFSSTSVASHFSPISLTTISPSTWHNRLDT